MSDRIGELECPNCGHPLTLIHRDLVEGIVVYFIHENRLEYKESEFIAEDRPYCPVCLADVSDFLREKGIEFEGSQTEEDEV